MDVRQTPAGGKRDASTAGLDAAEEDAIALALELHADLLLMDDEEGATAARAKGFDRIKRTNFRYRQDVMGALLMEWQSRT